MGFLIGKNCNIHPTAVINVTEGFIGDGALILANARIEGSRVEIGRECFMAQGATIGGGSCFDPTAELVAGDWLHMGVNSHINIARRVTIGDEFGCGIETKIFTHGAYIDSYSLGAPVQWGDVSIGSNVWMPNAWVNPNLTVGDNVIVAARSLVNKSIPGGVLAGGVPAKVLVQDYLPRKLTMEQKQSHIAQIVEQAIRRIIKGSDISSDEISYRLDPASGILTTAIRDESGASRETVFELERKSISGSANEWSEILKDQLRRNGIRFRFASENGTWRPWMESRTDI